MDSYNWGVLKFNTNLEQVLSKFKGDAVVR